MGEPPLKRYFIRPLAKVGLANVAWMVEQAFLPVHRTDKNVCPTTTDFCKRSIITHPTPSQEGNEFIKMYLRNLRNQCVLGGIFLWKNLSY